MDLLGIIDTFVKEAEGEKLKTPKFRERALPFTNFKDLEFPYKRKKKLILSFCINYFGVEEEGNKSKSNGSEDIIYDILRVSPGESYCVSTYGVQNGKYQSYKVEGSAIGGKGSFNIGYGSCSIYTPNKELYIYISGGSSGVINPKYSPEVRSIYIRGGEYNTEELHSMQEERAFHTLVSIGSRGEIYAIGGQSMHGELPRLCEKYSIRGDAWTHAGRLQRGRYSFGATVCGDRYIYVFGGVVPLCSHIFECLDTNADKYTWEIINIKFLGGCPSTQDMLDNGYYKNPGVAQISSVYIMVFGGSNATRGKLEGYFMYNIEKGEGIWGGGDVGIGDMGNMGDIYSMGNRGNIGNIGCKEGLMEGEEFYRGEVLRVGAVSYVVGSESRNIHLFNAFTMKWAVIPAYIWMNLNLQNIKAHKENEKEKEELVPFQNKYTIDILGSEILI